MFPHPQNIWILVLVYLYLEEGRRLIVLLCFNRPQTEKNGDGGKLGLTNHLVWKVPLRNILFLLWKTAIIWLGFFQVKAKAIVIQWSRRFGAGGETFCFFSFKNIKRNNSGRWGGVLNQTTHEYRCGIAHRKRSSVAETMFSSKKWGESVAWPDLLSPQRLSRAHTDSSG